MIYDKKKRRTLHKAKITFKVVVEELKTHLIKFYNMQRMKWVEFALNAMLNSKHLTFFKLLFFDSFDCFVSKSVRVNDSQLASW